MKTRYTIAFAIALILLCIGCQKDESFHSGIAESEVSVRFAPFVAIVKGDVSMSGGTKGALVNDTDNSLPLSTFLSVVNSFKVSAWKTVGAETSVSIPAFTTVKYRNVDPPYWITVQTNDSDLEYKMKKNDIWTFYAYANLPTEDGVASVTNTVSTGQTLTLNVPSSASGMTDIIMATSTVTVADKTSAIVPFTFYHPLTAVSFKLGKVEGTSSFTVNSISINGVYASGTAVMTPESAAEVAVNDKFIWTPSSSTITVSQTVTTQPTDESPQIGEPFLLIPQTFASNTAARIKIDCTIDGTSTTLYYPLTGISWQAGKVIDYHLEYANGFLIFAESEVNDWNEILVDM